MLKITVVVAIYNVGDYLEQCIKSIMNQTYKNIEIILVNDGSKDGCLPICNRLALMDNRIKIIDQENQGVSVARNNGMREATGDYIMFVDGDDCLKRNIIELLLKCSENNDVVMCSYQAFNESNSFYKDCHFFEKNRNFSNDKIDLYLQLMDSSYKQKGKFYTAIGVPWGKLYKRKFLEEYQLCFDSHLIRMQDNIFNMEVFIRAKTISYIDEPLYMYRLNNILNYKKLPCKPEYLLSVLYKRDDIISKFDLEKNEKVMDYFAKEILLSALKTEIYTSRTMKFHEFKKATPLYLNENIYSKYRFRYKSVGNKTALVNAFMKTGLNIFTYLIARYIKF